MYGVADGGQYGASGKHVEDAEPVRPGKLVDRAEPVRMACQYKSSSILLLYPENLGSRVSSFACFFSFVKHETK
jgi:hypothetical protein